MRLPPLLLCFFLASCDSAENLLPAPENLTGSYCFEVSETLNRHLRLSIVQDSETSLSGNCAVGSMVDGEFDRAYNATLEGARDDAEVSIQCTFNEGSELQASGTATGDELRLTLNGSHPLRADSWSGYENVDKTFTLGCETDR